MKSELRKILEGLCEDYHSEIEHGQQEQKKLLPYTVDAILELFNKQLPKKITTVVIPDFPESRLFAEAYSKGQAVGHNSCLADIRRAAGLKG